jgi:hypothetical protein
MMKLLKTIAGGLLSAMIGLQPVVAYDPDSGFFKPTINQSFSQATANVPVVVDYTFGSSATAPTDCAAGGTCAALTTLANVATYFNGYSDSASNTGVPVKTNSELEQYCVPVSSCTSNFVLDSTDLALTGTLGSSGNTVAPIQSGTLGNNSSFSMSSFTASTMGISSTSGVTVGNVIVLTYIGEYYITGITGSGGTATITTSPLMGSSSSIGAGKYTPWAIMPWSFGLTSTGAASGTATLSFSARPAGCVGGNFVGLYDNTGNTDGESIEMYASAEYQILSTTSTTIVLVGNLADGVNTGQGVFCTPSISSAQIWTKAYYNPPGWGNTYFAIDATLELPQNAVTYSSSGTYSGAASNGAYGAWPAFWLYGGSGASWADASEIDNLEGYNNILRNTESLDINVRFTSVQGTNGCCGGGSNAGSALGPQTAIFLWESPWWEYNQPNYTYNTTTDYGAAFHHWQMFWTPDNVYSYIDGQLIKVQPYHWTSSRQFQVAVNMAIGSLQNGLAINNLYPIASTNFPMTEKIREIQFRAK